MLNKINWWIISHITTIFMGYDCDGATIKQIVDWAEAASMIRFVVCAIEIGILAIIVAYVTIDLANVALTIYRENKNHMRLESK